MSGHEELPVVVDWPGVEQRIVEALEQPDALVTIHRASLSLALVALRACNQAPAPAPFAAADVLDGAVEPSDLERGEWPDATRGYVEALEAAVTELQERVRGIVDGSARAAVSTRKRIHELLDAAGVPAHQSYEVRLASITPAAESDADGPLYQFAGFLSVQESLPPTRGEAYPWHALVEEFKTARARNPEASDAR